MNKEQAVAILKKASWVGYHNITRENSTIQLDGDFDLEELEALVFLMKAKVDINVELRS